MMGLEVGLTELAGLGSEGKGGIKDGPYFPACVYDLHLNWSEEV